MVVLVAMVLGAGVAPAGARAGTEETGGVQAPAAAGATSGQSRPKRGSRPRHRTARADPGRRPAVKPKPAPVKPKPVTPAPTPTPAGVPTPAQTAAEGFVFPVGAAHNFGGPENAFGAPREGHVHEGQDILTTEGAPVVAPTPGTIASVSYQEGGAGYYVVEDADADGGVFAFMFGHCVAGSTVVVEKQVVAAGQQLCSAGQTGDATAPHLYFEMWVGGWYAPGGYQIDPLPYLQAWEQDGAGG
jgi:murein DD-endopeptidase MepM/ murein hydrolase activator NlpD